MTVTFNKYIPFNELKEVLEKKFNFCHVIKLGDTDLNTITKNCWIDYCAQKNSIGEFLWSIDVYSKPDLTNSFIENLAQFISLHFDCKSFCDASRIVEDKINPFYVILYEGTNIYLAHDHSNEKQSIITKVVKLNYSLPSLQKRHQIN